MPIDAILTDPDGTVSTSGRVTGTTPETELGYTWYRSKVADPEIGDTTHWNEITDMIPRLGTVTRPIRDLYSADGRRRQVPVGQG